MSDNQRTVYPVALAIANAITACGVQAELWIELPTGAREDVSPSMSVNERATFMVEVRGAHNLNCGLLEQEIRAASDSSRQVFTLVTELHDAAEVDPFIALQNYIVQRGGSLARVL